MHTDMLKTKLVPSYAYSLVAILRFACPLMSRIRRNNNGYGYNNTDDTGYGYELHRPRVRELDTQRDMLRRLDLIVQVLEATLAQFG